MVAACVRRDQSTICVSLVCRSVNRNGVWQKIGGRRPCALVRNRAPDQYTGLAVAGHSATGPRPGSETCAAGPAITEPPCIQEVGGRSLICGETVVVTGNPDEPVRKSSVATKIETPLVETPRSISTIDRRTLDDIGVINITQAHDYAVGFTPLDERGPASLADFQSASTICDATACVRIRGACANLWPSTGSSIYAALTPCCMGTAARVRSSTWCSRNLCRRRVMRWA